MAVKAFQIGEISDGEAYVIPGDRAGTGEPIAVFLDEGEYYALDDTCSHEDASLADGWIENGEVECPLHSTRFCLKSGDVLCMPATEPVKAYKVEVVDDAVYVHPDQRPEA